MSDVIDTHYLSLAISNKQVLTPQPPSILRPPARWPPTAIAAPRIGLLTHPHPALDVSHVPSPVRFFWSRRGLPRTLMPSIDSVVHTFREADAQAHWLDL